MSIASDTTRLSLRKFVERAIIVNLEITISIYANKLKKRNYFI